MPISGEQIRCKPNLKIVEKWLSEVEELLGNRFWICLCTAEEMMGFPDYHRNGFFQLSPSECTIVVPVGFHDHVFTHELVHIHRATVQKKHFLYSENEKYFEHVNNDLDHLFVLGHEIELHQTGQRWLNDYGSFDLATQPGLELANATRKWSILKILFPLDCHKTSLWQQILQYRYDGYCERYADTVVSLMDDQLSLCQFTRVATLGLIKSEETAMIFTFNENNLQEYDKHPVESKKWEPVLEMIFQKE